jgi:uncharacterized sulfatase
VEHFKAKLKPDHKHQNATYAAMVKNLDANVGRVLDHLQSRGLAEKTIVIFTSDNGGYIGRDRKSSDPNTPCTSNHPLRSGKGALYEGGIRIPLLIRGPNIPSGERASPTTTTDLFFTLLAAANSALPAPRSALPPDGLDLTPILRDPAAQLSRTTLHWHYPHYYETTTPASAIRSGDWKLFEYFEDNRRELYNLATDPTESHDLASTEPAKLTDLSDRLAAWRAAVGAKLPAPNASLRPNN